MEKTSYKQTEEAFQENINATLKWFSETTTTILDVYSKQCEFGIGIYKKLIAASLNPNQNQEYKVINIEALISNTKTATEVFKKLIHSTIDTFNITGNGINQESGFAKTILDTFINHVKLIEQYNETYLEIINSQSKDPNDAFKTYLNNYKKTFKSNIEIAEESLKLVLDNYTKSTNSGSKNKERFITEIDKLIDFVADSMLKFWDEILKTTQKSSDEKKQQNKTQTSQTKSKPSNISDKKITIKQ